MSAHPRMGDPSSGGETSCRGVSPDGGSGSERLSGSPCTEVGTDDLRDVVGAVVVLVCHLQ